MSKAPNINRSRIHEPMVQRLCSEHLPGVGKTLFPTIREFLCFSALLGYSEGRKIPLDKSKGVEDVSYQQFERGNAEELIFAIAVGETKTSDILKEDRESECAEIFEEYANGGMELLQEWLTASSDQPADRAIFLGLKEAGYVSIDDEEIDLESAIDEIKF